LFKPFKWAKFFSTVKFKWAKFWIFINLRAANDLCTSQWIYLYISVGCMKWTKNIVYIRNLDPQIPETLINVWICVRYSSHFGSHLSFYHLKTRQFVRFSGHGYNIGPEFEWSHFQILVQPKIDHSKTRLVRYSDVHCTYFKKFNLRSITSKSKIWHNLIRNLEQVNPTWVCKMKILILEELKHWSQPPKPLPKRKLIFEMRSSKNICKKNKNG
jgi:hypothetical protein